MKNKKLQKLSIAALIVSLLPLATYIPILFKITVADSVNSIWAGGNIACVILGLLLSVICVKSKESRSGVNIAAMVIALVWFLMMVGIVALAVFMNFLQ